MSELRTENRRHASASKALTWLYGGLCIARCNQTLQSPLAENSQKSLEEGKAKRPQLSYGGAG